MMPTVSEKLLQVAQNNPKVYHSGQLNIVKNAECLKNNKSGSVILIDDISPITHEMGVKVRGKNLFNYDDVAFNGISVVKENNSFRFINNSTNGYYFATTDVSSFNLKANTKYTSRVTVTLTDNGSSSIYAGSMHLSLMLQTNGTYDSSGKAKVYVVNGSNLEEAGTYEIVTTFITPADMTDYKYIVTRLGGNCSVTFKDLQIELGSNATSYTPYISNLTGIKFKKYGKNLFSGLTKGVGINSNNGSEITNSNYAVSDYIPVDFNTNTNYYISGLPTTISNYIAAYNANKEFLGRTGGNAFAERRLTKTQFPNGTPQGTGDIAYLRVSCFKISTSAGTVDDIDDCNIQLEIGLTATDYEPYNSATFTPTADGTVNGVTSLYPNTTLMTDTDGVIIDCEYYKDIDKTFNELTTSVALSGGDS